MRAPLFLKSHHAYRNKLYTPPPRGANKWLLFFRYMLRFMRYYKLFEICSPDTGGLPGAPGVREKYLYTTRNHAFLVWCSVISFSAMCLSMVHFLLANVLLWPYIVFFILTVVYFVVSLIVNSNTKNFDLRSHCRLVAGWRPIQYPDIDVFLPSAGESLDILRNTWNGVQNMIVHYPGNVFVYSLDDSASPDVARLARTYGFIYESRPNRGEFKKAGNLRHGFVVSRSPFIAIFDADFKPRPDFLKELLPYFDADPRVGIVQSPQYFNVSLNQGWLERGAGAVQELFYRFAQVSRQSHDAAICVGSNALYRRTALDDIGGTALIEHSEDVHTGFNLRMHGWTIQYIPVILAKGLCPAGMTAFFKQQYRWCMGSMSLMTSRKFWQHHASPRTRMSYFSGFLYYVATALGSIYTPFIPLALLLFYPQQVLLHNYLLVLPAVVFTQILYPLWHRAPYGIEAWATRLVYGWAHLFAIADTIQGTAMPWQATGSKMSKDRRYGYFRILQVSCNFLPAIAWVGLAVWRGTQLHSLAYVPMAISGLYYAAISAKVTFYHQKSLFRTVHTRSAVTVATADA
jgi:cellulose synthase (UDP-forming)